MKHDIIQQTAFSAPPVAVAAWTMNDILIGTSIVYVLVQIAYLLWKWRKDYKEGKK